MKKLSLLLFLLLPLAAEARFLFQYGLNYSSEKDSSDNGYEKQRTFHKVFLGASVNGKKTLFFGWGINSWNSSLATGDGPEDKYSFTEMGPKMLWFFSEEYHWYVNAEWNPYARGDRTKAEVESEISGSSLGVGLGYRFKLSRFIGLGASIQYHSLGMKEEKIASTENNISDSVSHIMPMLDLTILTR